VVGTGSARCRQDWQAFGQFFETVFEARVHSRTRGSTRAAIDPTAPRLANPVRVRRDLLNNTTHLHREQVAHESGLGQHQPDPPGVPSYWSFARPSEWSIRAFF
jgi:hypothetical protein